MTFDGDRDGLDDEALHLVAVDDGGEVVGTCRMLIEPGGDARASGACACARARAGRGVGARAARRGRARGARRRRRAGSACTRRPTRSRLYRRAGFPPYGERFDEEGIEHLGMEKDL